MSGNTITKIIEVGPGYNICLYDDGVTKKREGARNWRNNNPGNIEYGAFTMSCGAIGSDPRFAIFPTYDMGNKAQETLIFETDGYKNLTLSQAISKYAPPVENDTHSYQTNVLASVGNKNQAMHLYTEAQRQAILAAMHRQEGFVAGTISIVTHTTKPTAPPHVEESADDLDNKFNPGL